MLEAPPIEGAFLVDRLIGVPSHHHDPIFAQIAVRVIETLNPSVVALELPCGLEKELEWAASCWPGPVVSESHSALFPFVPGDSIFESYRCAKSANIPVVLIDLPCVQPAAKSRTKGLNAGTIGPEWAPRASALFLETTDALFAKAGRTERASLAREAHMARAIARLSARGERVLWVGGMAHWTRIVARIHDDNFKAPAVDVVTHSIGKRMRLAPTALHRMTGRLPWLVARYAANPVAYDEHAATQALALEATKEIPDIDVVLIAPGQSRDALTAIEPDESIAPIDVAKMLLYARNLAATGGLRERPDFVELLTSAAAIVSPRYAGRLYSLAMNEQSSPKALAHDALEWELAGSRERYRCGDEVIDSRPWWPAQGGLVVTIAEARRRARDELYKDLPAAGKGGKRYWECDPRIEDDYVSFVEYLLRRASLTDPEEAKSIPFRNGLLDGIDVRETLRNWSKETIYVREEQRGHLNFTNGAIDWTSMSEHSDVLTGKIPGGWIDPDLTRTGSCSREQDDTMKVLARDPWTQLQHRDFSLITLDCPTFHHRSAKQQGETFFDHVINPLIDIQRRSHDNLYAWLDIMFKFCAGKPFAYYSRYVPSPQIHQIAWKHGVRVLHFPLQRLPQHLVNRHKTFRFFSFTRKQWREFERRRSAAGGTWSSA